MIVHAGATGPSTADDTGVGPDDAYATGLGERYRLLIDHHPHAIVVTGPDGRVLEANPAAVTLTGRSAADMVGRHVGGLVEILDPTPVRAALDKAEREGPQQFDMAVRVADRTPLDLHATVIPITVEAQHVGTVAVLEDVTEQRVLARELEAARAVASAAADARSSFVARTSHEVRTPLTSILAVSELLDTTTATGEQQHLIGTLTRATRRLMQLIDNVLDFAAGDAAADARAGEAFDMHDLIHDAVANVDASARRKGLSIGLEIDDDVPRQVRDHPTWTSQILVNLLSNAVAFTDQGSVELAVSYIPTSDLGPCLVYRITDSGVGISPQDGDLIFEPFASPLEGEAPAPGIGLGLNVVRQLIRMSGGTISFSSRPGAGSVFTVVMPVVPQEAAS